jgi:hypothetical protein
MTDQERVRKWIEETDLQQCVVDSDVAKLVALLEAVRAEATEAAARPFIEEIACSECGEAMHAAVSLWRCRAHPGEHQATGPGIAYEIRTRVEDVSKAAGDAPPESS